MRSTAKMRRATKQPEEGSRSKNMFGVSRLFAQEWFNTNTHCGGAAMAQPTIRPFEKYRSRTANLKKWFIETQSAACWPKSEAVIRWQSLVIAPATSHATTLFNALEKGSCLEVVPLNAETLQHADAAAATGWGIVDQLAKTVARELPVKLSEPECGVYCLSQTGRLKVGQSDVDVGNRATMQTRGGTKDIVKVEWVYRVDIRLGTKWLETNIQNEMIKRGAARLDGSDWFLVGNTGLTPDELFSIAKRISIASEVSTEIRARSTGEGRGRFPHDAPLFTT
jgi:hypothetical protein